LTFFRRAVDMYQFAFVNCCS